jgi:hypothetical protein
MKLEQENNFEVEARKEDLDFLQEKLEEIHPDPYRNINHEKEIFEESLEKSLTVPEEFFPWAMQESLALLKDNHTGVGISPKEILPLSFLEFENSFYIIGAENEHKERIGSKVSKINGFSLNEINEQTAKLSSKENSETLLYDLQAHLKINDILKYYNFSNSENLLITTDRGEFEIQASKSWPKIIEKMPLKYWEEGSYEGNMKYRFKIINGKTLIFQYNICNNKDFSKKTLKDFKEKLLTKSKEVQNIIVDLRLNNGGYTKMMADLFKKLPEDKQIYVASSRKTYSSAMHHLIYLKRSKKAIVIGANARQKANRFGEGKLFKLPNSKISICCSKKYFKLYPEKDLEIIEPDIKIPVTIEDYVNNTDPLNNWVEENLE